MSAESLPYTCVEADCAVREGRPPCKLGNSITECPNASSTVENLDDDKPKDSTPEVLPSDITHHGRGLAFDEALSLTTQDRVTVVTVAALQGWGKTTLLTAIHELFQEGAISDMNFAGSRTLVGFEERRHDTRTTSRRATAHMERTYRGADAVLHLAVERQGTIRQLLMADLPGERFEALRDSDSAVDALPILRRTDHLTVLVDGAGLADPTTRHVTRHAARTILRVILSAGVLPPGACVEVVLTKCDALIDDTARAAATDTLTALAELASQAGHPVETIQTSALIPARDGVMDEGLVQLLATWTETPPQWAIPVVSDDAEEADTGRRAFISYARRT